MSISDFLAQGWWAGAGAIIALIALLLGVPAAIALISDKRAARRARKYLAGIDPERIENRRKVFGRDTDVAALRDLLTDSGAGAISPVATGAGGIGKTTLARHYAQVHAGDYAVREILRSESESTLISDLAALASRRDPAVAGEIERARAQRALDMIQAAAATQPWLLIYDNADSPEVLERWKAKGRHLHVLVTTRFPDWFGAGFAQYRVGVLDPKYSLQLLRNEAGRDDPGLPDLANKLGHLPLALVQAGEWLRARRRNTAEDYLQDIGRLRERTPVPGMTSDQDRTTVAVVEQTLGLLSRDARAVLDLLAWYAPDGIVRELVTELRGVPRLNGFIGPLRHVPRRIWAMSRDADRVDAAFAELRQNALLEDGDAAAGYRIHRIFQEVLRSQVKLTSRAGFRKARAAAAILAADYFAGAKTPLDPANWVVCRRLTPHVAALWGAAEPLWRGAWDRPSWHAMDLALSQCGGFLSTQSDFHGAELVRRAALELMERRVDAADRALPVALGNLSLTLAKLGKFNEAAGMIDRAIALDETHRPASMALAARYMQKANLYFRRAETGDRSELGSAEPWITDARAIRERLAAGQPSPDVALCWNDLGYLRDLQGRQSESAEAYQTALDILRQVPGVNRAQIATSAVNVGATWLESGAPDTAAPFLREAHGIHAEIFDDPQNPTRQMSTGWLVSCLLTLARAGHDPAHNRAEAAELCRTHGLDWEFAQRRAAQYPTRRDAGGAG